MSGSGLKVFVMGMGLASCRNTHSPEDMQGYRGIFGEKQKARDGLFFPR